MKIKFTKLILGIAFFLVTNAKSNAQTAFVPNQSDNTVSVINVATNTVTSIIPVGIHPIGVSVSPDGSIVYITNIGDISVSVINTATNTVSAIIPVGNNPKGVSVSPDGSKVYVANENDNTVSIINTATNTVSATITVGTNPFGMCVSPDGSKVYVANFSDSTVSVIATATNTVSATITAGNSPDGICVSPDGTKVYVANYGGNTVSVINTATNTVSTTIPVGNNPYGLSINPNGTNLYVANHGDNTVSVIYTATNILSATITVGNYPYGISISPDGTKVYAANEADNTVSVINTATNTVSATITVGNRPYSFGNFISTYTITTDIPSYVPTNGLVAWYPFTGNANDSSGNGNNGTVNGATLTYDRFCNPNSAYSFNAIGDYITGSCTNYPTADRTISLWFFSTNFNMSPPQSGLMGYGGGGYAVSWYEVLSSTYYGMSCHWNVNTVLSNYSSGPPSNQWHLWVTTIDTSGTKFYIDGLLYSSSPTYISNTMVNGKVFVFGQIVSPDGISAYTDGSVGQYQGVLDDIGIWNRALTPAEVMGLYVINNPATITTNGDTTFCVGDSLTLSTNANSSYLWSNSSTTQSINVNTTGTYTVTVTNCNGNTAISSPMVVTVNPLPTLVVSTSDTVLCLNASSIGLMALPIGGLWTGNGVSGSNFVPSIAGSGNHPILYHYTDGNGCIDSTAINMTVNPLPTLNVSSADTVFCTNWASTSLFGLPSGGIWSGSGVTGNSFSPSSAGIGNHPIVYSFTDSNGCTNTDTLRMIVNSCTGILGLTKNNSISFYPNPTTSSFTLLLNAQVKDAEVVIYDVIGNEMMRKKMNDSSMEIEKGNMQSGVYFVKVWNNDWQGVEKIVVE
jgi:YVTN family beta-propeller protein